VFPVETKKGSNGAVTDPIVMFVGTYLSPQMLADGVLSWDFLCNYVRNFYFVTFMSVVQRRREEGGLTLSEKYGHEIMSKTLRINTFLIDRT
jgi:hypothetical protein